MMKVPVDNQHFFDIVSVAGVHGSYGNIVENAEAGRIAGTGVMTGGAHKGEGVIDIARDDRVDGIEQTARGK